MSNVLNRTTKQFLASVNEPDYPLADWIHDPDVSAVAGWANKYWIITGDIVSLAPQVVRDQIDADERDAARDSIAGGLDQVEDIMRAFALVMLDEINLHAGRITAILDAVDNANNMAALKTDIALIPDIPQRTIGQLKTALRNKLGS